MSYNNFYWLTAAFMAGLGLSIIIMILGTLPDDNSEPSIEVHKWYDVEEENICYWVQPRYDTVALSCVRAKEREE